MQAGEGDEVLQLLSPLCSIDWKEKPYKDSTEARGKVRLKKDLYGFSLKIHFSFKQITWLLSEKIILVTYMNVIIPYILFMTLNSFI